MTPENTTTTDTREALAAYAHEAWNGWMEYLFKQGTTNADGSFTIRPWAVERWTRQMRTPYAALPESEKLSDQAEAQHILTIIADPSVAPTAAPAAADPAPTSPAEAGRQQYLIRRYRLDSLSVEPTFVDEITSAYLDTIYGDTTEVNRVMVCTPRGEQNVIDIYICRTPLHAVAMLAAINAIEDDMKHGIEEEPAA